MKLIEPNVQEITDFEGVDNFYKAVARAARICYAKEMLTDEQAYNLFQYGKITLSESLKNTETFEGNKALCERLIKSGHFSPFEHAIIYTCLYKANKDLFSTIKSIEAHKYSIRCIYDKESDIMYNVFNGRVIIEGIIAEYGNDINIILKILDEILRFYKENEVLIKDKNKFKSFIVDTSIGCTREMNRHHDNFYIVEQSTRYCNFSKDKFGNEVAFNKPYWYDQGKALDKSTWDTAMRMAEELYITGVKEGMPTDIARGILPLDTHTRAIYTATIEEWQHIIDLRLKGTTGKPHGDIMIIADKIDKLIHHK